MKDAGLTCYEHLTSELTNIGFIPTQSDPCVYTKGSNIIMIYVDDCIIISRSEEEVEEILKILKTKVSN